MFSLDIQPKATEYLPEMIELIEQLIEKGFAYEKDGHVLFHVLAKKYGALSKRNRDEQLEVEGDRALQKRSS